MNTELIYTARNQHSSSGQWVCLIDSPPKLSFESEEEPELGMSDLLLFRVNGNAFYGYYYSDSEMGWVVDENHETTNYEVESIEYQRG